MTSLTHDSPALAETYDRLSDWQFAGGKRLVDRLGVKAGERVLDIGCGTGRLARFIAEITGPAGVVGIDPLADRVQVARDRSPGLTFAVGQAEDLGAFGDGSFDVVCMSAVFHWVADKAGALREIRRVLEPAGRMGLTTPAKELRGTSTTARACAQVLAGYGAQLNPAGFGIAQTGSTLTELVTLLAEAQLEILELHLVRRTQYFTKGRDVFDFLQSSSFGNFARLVTDDAKASFASDMAAAFEALKGPGGIAISDHGTLVVASR